MMAGLALLMGGSSLSSPNQERPSRKKKNPPPPVEVRKAAFLRALQARNERCGGQGRWEVEGFGVLATNRKRAIQKINGLLREFGLTASDFAQQPETGPPLVESPDNLAG